MWPASIWPHRSRMSRLLGLTLALAFVQPASADWRTDYGRARIQRDIASWDLERAKACVERASARVGALQRRANYADLEIWKQNYQSARQLQHELETAFNFYRQYRDRVPDTKWSRRATGL